MYYNHNQQLFENLANWHEIWAEYREFQVESSAIDVTSSSFFFSVKQVILIDSNVEVIQLFKKKNNANISNLL